MNCESCKWFRVRGTPDPDDLYAEGHCGDEDESNPMSWQNTYSDFGCNRHKAKPRVDFSRLATIQKFCEAKRHA